MAALEWKQPELSLGDPGIGDAATQLFEGRRQMRLEIFVREDLQNRVDARLDESSDPVRVRITLQTLPAELIDKYFPKPFQDFYRRTETQALHGEEKARRLMEIDRIFGSADFPVLVIEDFNSTGLNGPVNSAIPENDSDSPLYHPSNALTCFFRRNGKSGKTDKKLGSAGLGRHVYYKASQISSKLIYTVPYDLCLEEEGGLKSIEARPLFLGQSFQYELAERDGSRQRRFCPYHNLSAGTDDELPMPFGLNADEADLVEQARKDFRLTRRSDESGCSVIIPFPKNNFTQDGLINSIVRDFPMPVLEGMLQVEIGDVSVDSSSIAQLSDRAEVNQHNCFLREALSAAPDAIVKVDPAGLRQPFGEDLFDPSELTTLAVAFNDGALVCVQGEVRFGDRDEQFGNIRIAVQRAGKGLKGRQLVARSGLVLSDSKYSDRNFTSQSNAVVMVQADGLGSLLRSVENPAHSEWLPGDIDPHRCEVAEELINFIRNSHRDLARMLSNLDSQDDLSIFSDLVPAGKTVSEPAKDVPFDMGLEGDGQVFRVQCSPSYSDAPDTIWRLTLVYDSIQGSGRARKGYRPGTYDLRSAGLQIDGGEEVNRGECHLDVKILEPELFQLRVGPCGFAEWADLRIHASRQNGEGDYQWQ